MAFAAIGNICMLESIREKMKEQNIDNHPNNMSFDFKLMFIYHIGMMMLFATRMIDAAEQAWFAVILGLVLVIASFAHKVKAKWKWPGIAWYSIPLALLNIIFIYGFLAFSAFSFATNIEQPELNIANFSQFIKESWLILISVASEPVFTSWYLAGIGIGVFNLLTILKLVHVKKSDFEALCKK